MDTVSGLPIARGTAQDRLFVVRNSSDHRHIPISDRLELLRVMDSRRRWKSLDDERVCLICERKLTGRQIDFRRMATGHAEVRCPSEGCPSTPHEWVYLDDPRLRVPAPRHVAPVFGLTVHATG